LLWAVTSYFNPMGYERRRRNFVTFRERLRLPLLTVQWSQEGNFELGEGDTDVLVSLSGGDLMWQKERLLNVAVAALPQECDAVAWLDCDIVFEDDAWIDQLRSGLDRAPVVQLFSSVVHDAPRAGDPPLLTRDSLVAVRTCEGARGLRERICAQEMPPRNATPRQEAEARERRRLATRPTSGHAWAATRALLASHRLYDACICGTGDMAIALAAMGLPDMFLDSFAMNDRQRAHYRAWAEPFAAATGGNVGVLSTTIRHLFHGHLAERRYRTRLQWLSESGFDPAVDLGTGEDGLWRWQHQRAEREAWFRDYFERRREDGTFGPDQ
jgi:hypothetical protein